MRQRYRDDPMWVYVLGEALPRQADFLGQTQYSTRLVRPLDPLGRACRCELRATSSSAYWFPDNLISESEDEGEDDESEDNLSACADRGPAADTTGTGLPSRRERTWLVADCLLAILLLISQFCLGGLGPEVIVPLSTESPLGQPSGPMCPQSPQSHIDTPWREKEKTRTEGAGCWNSPVGQSHSLAEAPQREKIGLAVAGPPRK